MKGGLLGGMVSLIDAQIPRLPQFLLFIPNTQHDPAPPASACSASTGAGTVIQEETIEEGEMTIIEIALARTLPPKKHVLACLRAPPSVMPRRQSIPPPHKHQLPA